MLESNGVLGSSLNRAALAQEFRRVGKTEGRIKWFNNSKAMALSAVKTDLMYSSTTLRLWEMDIEHCKRETGSALSSCKDLKDRRLRNVVKVEGASSDTWRSIARYGLQQPSG